MRPGGALITGAGKRLGRAMAEALGADGWAVAVHYNSSADGAGETAAAIREAGGTAITLQADLSDEDETGGLVLKAAETLGQPVTLLVNSASLFEEDTAQDHTRETWDAHMSANLRAPVHLAQCFADALPKGEAGLIVNMLDQRVWKLTPQFFTYTLSKAALTASMAISLGAGRSGIPPSSSSTKLIASAARSSEAVVARGTAPVPLESGRRSHSPAPTVD